MTTFFIYLDKSLKKKCYYNIVRSGQIEMTFFAEWLGC